MRLNQELADASPLRRMLGRKTVMYAEAVVKGNRRFGYVIEIVSEITEEVFNGS